MVGVETVREALTRSRDTQQAIVTTTHLEGGQDHDLSLGELSSEVESVEFNPQDTQPPTEGTIMAIRPIVLSGSTNSTLRIFESYDRQPIHNTLTIEQLSKNDEPQTFQPAGGAGVGYLNQHEEPEMYFRITEVSGNESKYKFLLRWIDVR